MDPIDPQIIRRFFQKVIKTSDCWLFKNGVTNKTYGTFGFLGRVRKAHIVSWIIHFGDIPAEQCVLHKCDNPPCVRPDHLFLGSKKDNAVDAQQKGRLFRPPIESLCRGTDRKNAKLTDKLVIEIRTKYATGKHSYRSLAKDYGVNTRVIGHILHRRKWKHVN